MVAVQDAHERTREATAQTEALEVRTDEIAHRIWPATPGRWLGLLVSYAVALVLVVVLLCFLAPTWMPARLVAVLNPQSSPPPADGAIEHAWGNKQVRVKTARITRKLPGQGKAPVGTLNEQRLFVVLEIHNRGGSKAFPYNTWRDLGQASTQKAANAVDDQGNQLGRFTLPSDADEVAEKKNVEPDQAIVDTLHFAAPQADVRYVDLYLPGANIGESEAARLRIPADLIERESAGKK
jgi:hypothetical protein